MSLYTRIRDAIRTVADAGGGALQVTFGTPGTKVLMPEDADPNDFIVQKPESSGQAWNDYNPLKVMLSEMGGFLALYSVSWGFISTNATGVDPTVDNGLNLGAVTKNEVLNRLVVTVDPVYLDQRMFFTAVVLGTIFSSTASGYGVDHATFEFYDKAGVQQDVNSREVLVLFVGKRA